MSKLLIKRLARSLWRSKLRLFAVIIMVAMGVAAGISFGSYAQSAESQLRAVYADTETGVNLPDLWVDNNASVWPNETAEELCRSLHSSWPSDTLKLKTCEPRLVQTGMVLHTDEAGEEKLVTGVWHGITNAKVHRVWMPDHPSVHGRLAAAPDEVVIDAHASTGLGLEVGSTVTISAGQGAQEFKVVGIGYHADHLYFAPEGSVLPASEGTFVTGYLSAEGLEKLTGNSPGSANLLLVDIEGTPAYDLQTTSVNEGPELEKVIGALSETVGTLTPDPTTVYNRSGVQSVEFLRADAEGCPEVLSVHHGHAGSGGRHHDLPEPAASDSVSSPRDCHPPNLRCWPLDPDARLHRCASCDWCHWRPPRAGLRRSSGCACNAGHVRIYPRNSGHCGRLG